MNSGLVEGIKKESQCIRTHPNPSRTSFRIIFFLRANSSIFLHSWREYDHEILQAKDLQEGHIFLGKRAQSKFVHEDLIR
jgi:hypothetical protein